MQGTIALTPATARAFLLSAAIVTGASFASARAETRAAPPEETAFAIPRIATSGGAPIALPRPLSAGDAALTRRAFQAQAKGDYARADTLIAALSDRVLVPDLLAERYLDPAFTVTAAPLRAWLAADADHPDAPAVRARLIALKSGTVPSIPNTQPLSPDATHAPDPGSAPLPFTRNPLLDRTVADRVAIGPKGALSALRLIRTTPGLSTLYASQLMAEVAIDSLSAGHGAFALATAREAVRTSGGRLGFSSYIAGLAAWRQDLPGEAATHFEHVSDARFASGGLRAAAAYWAARSHARLSDPRGAAAWLGRAATSRDTFYGLLANEVLAGVDGSHGTKPASVPTLTLGEADVDAVLAHPRGRALLALLQVGEDARAEALLRRLWPDIASDPALCRSFQLVAQAAGLYTFSDQASALLGGHEDAETSGETSPVPNLHPRHGFRMDPALVYALARVESNFDPQAVSGAGAHGLMQIQPVTAGFVTHQNHADAEPMPVERLHNAATNLDVGQLYVLYLASLTVHAEEENARQAPDGGDMVRLLASYNAGPSAIAHWVGSVADEPDPLLFMETLPNGETRDYVHRAFTYLWIYAGKLGLPAPSLQALSHARWPEFRAELALAGAPKGATLH